MPTAAALVDTSYQTANSLLDGAGMSMSTGTINVTNGMIWTVWNAQYTTDCITTGTVNVSSTLSGGTAANTNLINVSAMNTMIWTSWNSAITMGMGGLITQVPQAQSEAQRQHFIEVEAERAKARERAGIILREHLSPEQAAELASKGRFHLDVLSRNGQRKRYRINRGRSRNVQEIEIGSDRVIRTLCAHPIAAVPDEDTMLAQKLMLERAEEEFLRIANVS